LTEAWSEDDEDFGEERLEQAIRDAPSQGVFDSILDSLHEFCGQRTQVDDVTLIEITCVPELLPDLSKHLQVPVSEHHFELLGDWEYQFSLKDRRLAETNPVPIIINQIMEMEGIETERQSLFTILTELYVNALDHGVLGLDSALKKNPRGFEQYFRQREKKMLALDHGRVSFALSVEQHGPYRSMLIRVEDSGSGFDHGLHEKRAGIGQAVFSGRGILLVKDLCESLNYLGNGNIAEAIFSWKTVQSEHAA
jgi:hypothetical protein